MSIQRNRIKIWRSASDLHQMFQDFSYFFRTHYKEEAAEEYRRLGTGRFVIIIKTLKRKCILPFVCQVEGGNYTGYPLFPHQAFEDCRRAIFWGRVVDFFDRWDTRGPAGARLFK